MRPTFEVVCKIEVCASSPERAATTARDMMLDPHTELHVDVHPIEFLEAADDWIPNDDRGWSVWFGKPVRQLNFKPPDSVVQPCECIEWIKSQ